MIRKALIGAFLFLRGWTGGCAVGWLWILGAGSDSVRGERRCLVRSWVRFRQRKGKWPLLSPKLDQVQTEEEEIIVFESEVGSG
uniref:hypothetical protein n=1 Tax=Cytobacillus firmus TaxID=1399 RepID=UPI002494620F